MSRFRYSAGFAVPALATAMLVVGSRAAVAQQGAVAAAAQPDAPACNIDETKPKEVAAALVSLQQAGVSTGDTKLKHIRAVMKGAEQNIAKGENLTARYEMMAKGIILFMADSTAPVKTTRGNLGLSIEPTKEIDTWVAADSLLTLVEKAQPGCATELAGWRQHQGWVNVMTAAGNAVDADKVDTAEALIKRSLIVAPKSAIAYQFLAVIANKRSDRAAEEIAWQKVIDFTSPTDTADAQLRTGAIFFLANALYNDVVFETDSVKRKAGALKAAEAFRNYLNLGAAATQATAARTYLAISLQTAGETAQIPSVYADLVANPDKYSGVDLYQAGTMAAQVDSAGQAVRLFEAAMVKMPYDRDLLYNLGAQYVSAKQYAKMRPLVTKLLSLDPENQDNIELALYSFALADTTGLDAAGKKMLADSATYYNNLMQTMQHSISIQQLEPTAAGTDLTGAIVNREAAEKTFTLNFEFLDQQGNAVGTASTTVAAKGQQSTAFKVSVPQKGIAGWRYKPFPK